jgi:TetR/AcrR family transcriptional regulator, ethionamide resistance regulator
MRAEGMRHIIEDPRPACPVPGSETTTNLEGVAPTDASALSSGERTYGRAEAAILTATEELLRERPLNELSVGDIIERAGISRTSFYVYFASKTAVIAECLRRVMDQVTVAVEPLRTTTGDDPEAAVRVSVERWVALATAHGALLRAVSEEWPHDEELRRLWFEMMATATNVTARVIRRARRRGEAPAGADPQALAACLMWAYERVLHVALVGEAQGLPEPEAMIAPLSQMLLGGLFGRPLAIAPSSRSR